MTTRVLGLLFYANLPPQQVSDATGPALRPRVLTGQGSSKQGGDGAVWTAQPSSDQWDGDVYPQSGSDPLAALTASLTAGSGYQVQPFSFLAGNQSAVAQYQSYAGILAAPYYPSLSLYA